MAININEIRITATISEQAVKKQNKKMINNLDANAIISAAVEAVLERLKEIKED